ncbi:MAG TPA: RluA family pseudouridine synthase [Hymenobacter sp.]
MSNIPSDEDEDLSGNGPDETEEDELYEHHRIVVDRGQEMLRIDKFLQAKLRNTSRNKVQEAIRALAVEVNGTPVKPNYRVKPQDTITITLPEPPREGKVVPEEMPLDIRYEYSELLIVNKPAGLVVHPAHGHWQGTLVNGLAHHLANLPTGRNGEVRPGLVHRIDKDTSGLLVIGKTEFAMTHLSLQFFHHTIARSYLALVWGTPPGPKGTISGHIGRSLRDRKVQAIYPGGEHGKPAVTHYEVLESFGPGTLVRCVLETGRTHQIRAHMQYIGHPLFSDSTYGGDRIRVGQNTGAYRDFVESTFQLMPRQALHARSLGFVHPTSGEQLFFEAELPPDFAAVLDKWRAWAA